jgi:hypothetical protein
MKPSRFKLLKTAKENKTTFYTRSRRPSAQNAQETKILAGTCASCAETFRPLRSNQGSRPRLAHPAQKLAPPAQLPGQQGQFCAFCAKRCAARAKTSRILQV